MSKFRTVLTHHNRTPFFQQTLSPLQLVRINYKMAKVNKTSRKTCRIVDQSISLTPSSPRRRQTIVDTPRRTRLIRDAELTADKWPRRELFKAHDVAETTGYQILKSNSTHHSQHIHNCGQKQILAPHQCDTIKTVKDSSF